MVFERLTDKIANTRGVVGGALVGAAMTITAACAPTLTPQEAAAQYLNTLPVQESEMVNYIMPGEAGTSDVNGETLSWRADMNGRNLEIVARWGENEETFLVAPGVGAGENVYGFKPNADSGGIYLPFVAEHGSTISRPGGRASYESFGDMGGLPASRAIPGAELGVLGAKYDDRSGPNRVSPRAR